MRSNRTSNYLFVIFLVVYAGARVHGQTPSASPTPTPAAGPTLEREFFKNIWRDQKRIWTSPARVRSKDVPWLVMLGVNAGGFIATDRATGDAMAKHTDQIDASRGISYAGSIYGVSAAAGSFYLIGRATHNARARETGILSGEAIINSLIVTTVLKEVTQRARPLDGKNRSRFFAGGTSFPSGHSMQAWAIATVIANEYHDHLAIQIAAYGIAGAVSVSRFTVLRHYLSDVLVGSAIGYGIGRYVYHAHHRENAPASGGDEEFVRAKRLPAITPIYGRRARAYGIALTWSF